MIQGVTGDAAYTRSGPGPTGFGVALLERWIDLIEVS